MQCCPYDAIYIDEDTHAAVKCNFCAHRIDADLEPACVVVCPTHSIWVGDLDDPDSGISRLVNANPVAVRAPEQNTGPNVFYLGADRAVLDPLACSGGPQLRLLLPDAHRAEVARDQPVDPVGHARTTLNTPHPRPWGWRVGAPTCGPRPWAGALCSSPRLAVLLGVDLGVDEDISGDPRSPQTHIRQVERPSQATPIANYGCWRPGTPLKRSFAR